MNLATCAPLDQTLFNEIYRLSRSGFSLLPLGGGQNGKSPLCKFAGKNPPVRQVIAIMNAKASSAYGVRLQDIVVVDVDENSQDIKSLVVRRFGNSPVQVETPRGRHFYFPIFRVRATGFQPVSFS